MPEPDVPYLIVGAGPVGLTAAHLFAAEGLPSLVVERRDGPQRHPAAHVVNARTLEIFRQVGLDMAAIAAVAKDPADAGHVNWVTRLDGDLIGRLPFERQGPEVEALTPTPLRNISQHRLEPLMAEAAHVAPEIDLRYRSEWVSSTQDDDGVTSVIRDLDRGETWTIRSRYVLAADGAGSRVRTSLGIEMVGPSRLQSFIAIHFHADLRHLIADRLGVLHFVMDPAAGGVFIAHDIDREWVFMVSYDPQVESLEDYRDERCAAIVQAAIGDTPTPIDVVGAGSWHMSAQVAQRMRAGRIFLVGDAAHRFPPTGGLGLNTGVADAQGLVWKLAAVDAGWADASILDTYEIERHPIAAMNCEQSATNAFKLVLLVDALGLAETPTTEAMRAALSDPANQATIDDAVAEQATHFDMLGLQLGYSYAEGALERTGAPPAPIEDPRVFAPDGVVGTRLPHAWLGDGRSTLDLIEPGAMTLIGVGGAVDRDAALAATSVPVRRVSLDPDQPGVADWTATCRLSPGELMLVRPDQHIAWRSGGDASIGLAAALNSTLGR